MKLFGTEDIASQLKVSRRRVQAMFRSGRLKGVKLGRDWFAQAKDIRAIRNRKTGRPPTRRK